MRIGSRIVGPRASVDDDAFADFRVAAVADVDAAMFRVEHLAAENQDLARIDDFDGPPSSGLPARQPSRIRFCRLMPAEPMTRMPSMNAPE